MGRNNLSFFITVEIWTLCLQGWHPLHWSEGRTHQWVLECTLSRQSSQTLVDELQLGKLWCFICYYGHWLDASLFGVDCNCGWNDGFFWERENFFNGFSMGSWFDGALFNWHYIPGAPEINYTCKTKGVCNYCRCIGLLNSIQENFPMFFLVISAWWYVWIQMSSLLAMEKSSQWRM